MNNYSIAQVHSKFISKVYAWMSLGLLITGIISFFTASSPAIINFIFGNSLVFLGLVISNFLLVMGLSAMIDSISSSTAKIAFIIYSILTGFTFSAIFLLYTFSSIAIVFFITSLMFASMALYGHFTKADLTGMGGALTMCLIGLILSSVINMFLQNGTFDFIKSILGVIIFTLFTAYDAQKIKSFADEASNSEELSKLSIIGALELYLDFINLFLYLLKFMGRKK